MVDIAGDFPGGFIVPAGQTYRVVGDVHIRPAPGAAQCGSIRVLEDATLLREPNSGTIFFHGIDEGLMTGGGDTFQPQDPGIWAEDGHLDFRSGDLRPKRARGFDPSWTVNDTLLLIPPGWPAGDYTTYTPIRVGDPVPVYLDGLPWPIIKVNDDMVVLAEPGKRAHIKMLCHPPHTCVQRIEGGYDWLGPQGKIGLYPIHFHHMMASSIGSRINATVLHSGNRAFVDHDSDGITNNGSLGFDILEAAYWRDQAPDRAFDNVYLNTTAAFVRPAPGNKPFRISAYMMGTGIGSIARGNWAIGVLGPVDISTAAIGSGFHWPEGRGAADPRNGVWVFEDNMAFAIRGAGNANWQNNSNLHPIVRFKAVACEYGAIAHGAYANRFGFDDIECWGGRSTVFNKAKSDGPNFLTRIDGYGLVFERVRGHGTGLSHQTGHSPLPASTPTLLKDCHYDGQTALKPFTVGGADFPHFLDFVDCTQDGLPLTPELFDITNVMAGSRVRVENAGVAFKLEGINPDINGVAQSIELSQIPPFYNVPIGEGVPPVIEFEQAGKPVVRGVAQAIIDFSADGGMQLGDRLLVHIYSRTSMAPPPGWTQEAPGTWSKFADPATDAVAHVWTLGTGIDYGAWWIRVRGGPITGPLPRFVNTVADSGTPREDLPGGGGGLPLPAAGSFDRAGNLLIALLDIRVTASDLLVESFTAEGLAGGIGLTRPPDIFLPPGSDSPVTMGVWRMERAGSGARIAERFTWVTTQRARVILLGIPSEPLPLPQFSAQPSSGEAPLTVNVQDVTGAASIVTYDWGDGTQSTGAPGAAFQHTYTAPGSYTITLAAQDALGRTATATQVVAVLESVTSGFGIAPLPTVGDAPLTVTVQDMSTGPVEKVLFKFDMDLVIEVAPGGSASHTYQVPGSYVVEQTVIGLQGQTATAAEPVQVNAAPIPSSVVIDSIVVAAGGPGQAVTITALLVAAGSFQVPVTVNMSVLGVTGSAVNILSPGEPLQVSASVTIPPGTPEGVYPVTVEVLSTTTGNVFDTGTFDTGLTVVPQAVGNVWGGLAKAAALAIGVAILTRKRK